MDKKILVKYFEACSQGQSNYAIDNFVDGAQLTPERRFRQAVIEMEVATASYEDTSFDLRKHKLKLDKKRIKLSQMQDAGDTVGYHDLELMKLSIERKERMLERVQRSLEGRRRTLIRHRKNLEKSEKELGFDENTTEEEVYNRLQQSEADYYLTKFATDTAARFIERSGGPSVGILLALQQLPEEDIEKFQHAVQAVLGSMGADTYIPELHGGGTIKQLFNEGRKVLEAAQQKKLT